MLGLHLTRFVIGLSAQALFEGASAVVDTEEEEALLPLPAIGLYGNHEFSRAWSVSGRFDWFSLSSGAYSGRLTDALASVSYRFTDRVGVSFGYRLVDHSFEITRPTWRGGIDYRFSGPYVALRIGL